MVTVVPTSDGADILEDGHNHPDILISNYQELCPIDALIQLLPGTLADSLFTCTNNFLWNSALAKSTVTSFLVCVSLPLPTNPTYQCKLCTTHVVSSSLYSLTEGFFFWYEFIKLIIMYIFFFSDSILFLTSLQI